MDFPTPSSGDLSSFWTWFNTVAGPTLAFVLPVVGVVAGGLFVFFVGRLIIGSLRGMSGAQTGAQLQDPLAETGVFAGDGYEADPAIRAAYNERLNLLRDLDKQFPAERRRYVIGPDGEKRGKLRADEMRFLLASDKGDGKTYGGVKMRSTEYQTIKGAIRYAAGGEYSPVGKTKPTKAQRKTADDPLFLLGGKAEGKGKRRADSTGDPLYLVGGGAPTRRGRRGRDDGISLLPSAPGRRGRQTGSGFISLVGGDGTARRTRRRGRSGGGGFDFW